MVRKSWMTFVLATTLLGLTGCANDNDNAANNNTNDLGFNNVRNNAINGVNVRNVANQNLRVSARATRNVESLKEVDQANVIIRNNDAYVAVRLKGTQNGTRARGGTTGTGPNMNATYGNGYNSGTTGTNGSANLHATTGNINNANITGTRGTRTNARGINTLDQKIINQVRAADRSIDNVYISYDTDTFGQMTNYSNDIRTGTNRNDLWDDFSNFVNRMFR
ncbi:YhcN/YlaJ family sporulation lipoprotein [Neobacillus sp. MER 74]|uniref:YhcN/YlaJ family sporulation lipoprotein n=1 Tax=Neobacillus sp. MER 74 TaxID=2939566 RepID=UPI00203EEFBA|nr:YhcN/YlaJ family sporulation lipoprotein [Neobacillus sp. MER 74]MCM3117424.1 YhcN/YlaJ family sporulation lipoprotein [Neobacillus sp. MER 74]